MKIEILKPQSVSERLNRKLRVCAYARVSTDHTDQKSSIAQQTDFYKEMILSNEDYEFVGVYTDQGISGYKEKRPGFQKMIAEARAGNIDLIITKSISRFARNTMTVLKFARELKELGIGIFFEIQGINTLSEAGELMMTVAAAFAQKESEDMSASGKLAYRHRYEQGIPVQYLERSFGYCKGENGEYQVDENDAKWIRAMYEKAAQGWKISRIRDYLKENNIKSVQGSDFDYGMVLQHLENEIYKGDYIMQKHYVNSDRKLVRNKGEVDSWYIENDHVPIVSKELWAKAQEQIQRWKALWAEESVVGELNTDTYPYMDKIFCAKCGWPLKRRVYSNGNKVCWTCSGMHRGTKAFCEGVNVLDAIIRSKGEITKNTYISKEGDDFKFVAESTWERTNKRKDATKMRKKKKAYAPELNTENYPHYKKIYCGKCGRVLTRHIGLANVFWVCSGQKKYTKKFCEGVSVKDDEVRSWGEIEGEIYVERSTDSNGKKCHSYSSHYKDRR